MSYIDELEAYCARNADSDGFVPSKKFHNKDIIYVRAADGPFPKDTVLKLVKEASSVAPLFIDGNGRTAYSNWSKVRPFIGV